MVIGYHDGTVVRNLERMRLEDLLQEGKTPGDADGLEVGVEEGFRLGAIVGFRDGDEVEEYELRSESETTRLYSRWVQQIGPSMDLTSSDDLP